MKFRYARYCTLLEAQDYWWNKEDVNAQSENGLGTQVTFRTHPTYTCPLLQVHWNLRKSNS
jgi:hypothetical protein